MMNVELGQFSDGGLVVVCDEPFPHEIRRVEYYHDQRLMMLVYQDSRHEGDLMHHELSDVAATAVEACPSILIVDHSATRKLYGYDVPLVQIGS